MHRLAEQGILWEKSQNEKLINTFGENNIIYKSNSGNITTAMLKDLFDTRLECACFLLQPEYNIGDSFKNATGLSSYENKYALKYKNLRPDIIQVLPVGSCVQEVMSDGRINGISPGDQRIPFRIIDIKFTSVSGKSHYAEVVYYTMALAGWLIDNGYNDKCFVVPHAAIWTGASKNISPVWVGNGSLTIEEKLALFDKDLEICEFNVFSQRLRRIFKEELPDILNTPWEELDWHVNSSCMRCNYLGYIESNGKPSHPEHCIVKAKSVDHLSRLAFISKGARKTLENHQIKTVSDLTQTHPEDQIYDSHHNLRASRAVVAGRAHALRNGVAFIPPNTGTTAIMPSWSDLSIFITTEFDFVSGKTLSFGFKALWYAGKSGTADGQPNNTHWESKVIIADKGSEDKERMALFALLGEIYNVMEFAKKAKKEATMQVYIWDNITYKHLTDVISRNIDAILWNNHLAKLAWLFPAESINPNPVLSGKCPVTILGDVVKSLVAAPVPHCYTLLNIARAYYPQSKEGMNNNFFVIPSFEGRLSDYIPYERVYEIWNRTTTAKSKHTWEDHVENLKKTVKTKLSALVSIERRLRKDLSGRLKQSAIKVSDLKPPDPGNMANDSKLWYVFAEYNNALEKINIQKIYAMPPEEREARFESALLTEQVFGADADRALKDHNLQPAPFRRVYRLSQRSSEVRAREGDFNFALSPKAVPEFLDLSLSKIANDRNLKIPLHLEEEKHLTLPYITGVSIAAIDRTNLYIVVDLKKPFVNTLEKDGFFDLSKDVMLDKVHNKSFLKKLKNTLEAIGNPQIAIDNSMNTHALGYKTPNSKATDCCPAAEFLWTPMAMYQTQVRRILEREKGNLLKRGFNLNESQWKAWDEALTHRLRLIWGPPGTGKSRTLKAIALGAIDKANNASQRFRMLITGPTYKAIDNVLLDIVEKIKSKRFLLDQITDTHDMSIHRLRSDKQPVTKDIPVSIDTPIDKGNKNYRKLYERFERQQPGVKAKGMTLVGATPHQVHNLLKDIGGEKKPLAELFDMIIIDEASQMDVATATLAVAGLSAGGTVIVAGDPQQLSPIHEATPPVGMENMVGSVFSYLSERFGIQRNILNINYRSCDEIIKLAYAAGYPEDLKALSPNLQIDIINPKGNKDQPLVQKEDFHKNLYWTPDWEDFITPSRKAMCFIYNDSHSSQWNKFEADAIATIAWLFSRRLSSQMLHDKNSKGVIGTAENQPYSLEEFWGNGIGIVTPHRAQQSLVIRRIQEIFPPESAPLIRSAVDTVERFQGQERDVILATFSLGDPDMISKEEEFILNLNRFNVMFSRARAKLIVFISQNIVDHLSSDAKVLKNSSLLKFFADSFCMQNKPLELGYIKEETPHQVNGTLYWR
jgi:hypothetical protein